MWLLKNYAKIMYITPEKHIDIRHHFIRETVQQGEIEVKHLASTEMLADLLTKALAFPTFSKLRQNIVVPK